MKYLATYSHANYTATVALYCPHIEAARQAAELLSRDGETVTVEPEQE